MWLNSPLNNPLNTFSPINPLSLNNILTLTERSDINRFEDLKKVLTQKIISKFWNRKESQNIVNLINIEVDQLSKTKDKLLQNERIKYLDFITDKFLQDKKSIKDITVLWLSDLKEKIDKIVDKNSLEWKMRAVIELVFANNYKIEDWNELTPFYNDDWVIKIALWIDLMSSNSPRDKKVLSLDSNQNPEQIKDELNRLYNDVKVLRDKSTPNIRNYMWMLFDIAYNPENIKKYQKELSSQPWYNDFIKKVDEI